MRVTVDRTLLEAARHIAPVIRDHNAEAERERRLSKPVLEALTEAGLLRMFTPRSLGGLEVDPLTCARVVEEVSAADSVAGWSLFNPLAWAHLCARLPDEGAEEMFGTNPHAVLAGPFHPPMQATPVDGGYRVTGRSPFASNCRDATWIAVTALVMDGDRPRLLESGAPEVLAVFLPSEACDILDTWYVLGMRGTGSDDIAVHDVFVPRTRTCPLVPEFTPERTTRGRSTGSRPWAPLLRRSRRSCWQSPARRLMKCRPSRRRRRLWVRDGTPGAGAAQARLAQAEGALRAARALADQTLGEAWERAVAGDWPSLAQKADLLLATATATSSAARVVELMYNVAGTSGIYMRNPLERYFRDIQVLKQHGFASENRYETVGQVYLGMPPEFAPVAL